MTTNPDFFFVKDKNGGFQKIRYEDILFVKSVGNYLQFVTTEYTVLTHGSLQSLASFLDHARYLQTHRSFIVHLDRIDRISSDAVVMGEHTLPIGSKFQGALLQGFVQRHLVKL